jgi:hypothetical protein
MSSKDIFEVLIVVGFDLLFPDMPIYLRIRDVSWWDLMQNNYPSLKTISVYLNNIDMTYSR